MTAPNRELASRQQARKIREHAAAVVAARAHVVLGVPLDVAAPPPDETFNERIEAARAQYHVVCMADVEPEEVRWIWPGYIPRGKLTVLEGDPGLGKSTLSLNIAAAVSRGLPLPGCTAAAPADVVLVSYEDGLADTLRPRLDAAGADVRRVHAIQGMTPIGSSDERLIHFPADAAGVFDVVSRLNAQLVIIDPLSASLSSETDSYKDADIRRVLAPIARFAEETNTAVVVVRHLTKSAGRAITSGGGSIGIGAAARSVLAVHEDPERPGERVLAVVKCNIAAHPPSLAFRLVGDANQCAHVEWNGESRHTANALALLRGETESPVAEREIDDWLRTILGDGPMERKEVFRRGNDSGFPPRSLDRAAQRLGVRRAQSGFGKEKHSEWSLASVGEVPAPPPTTANDLPPQFGCSTCERKFFSDPGDPCFICQRESKSE